MTTLMKKIDFARRCNVDRSRVTQWCKAGQISGAAIVGTGRTAMLDPAIALKQLKLRLSTNERCGLNGLSTNLDWLPGAGNADDDGMDEVERHRGIMVDLADVEYAIDCIWVKSDLTVQDGLKPFPEALAAYMAIRPQLAAIKDGRS
jgi:hypothetical protein